MWYSDFLRQRRIRYLENIVKFLSIVLVLLVTFFAGMLWERSGNELRAKQAQQIKQQTQLEQQEPYILLISRKE